MQESLRKRIEAAGQAHLLAHYDAADAAAQAKLEAQFSVIDWEALPGLIAGYVLKRPETAIPADLAPAPFFPFPARTPEQEKLYAEATAKGVEVLRAGKVAALTVAGGQGTRLGFDGPKGTYPITPVLHKTLFQYFAESICRISEKYGAPLTWYIMCSELNAAPTKEFFEKNNFFGLADGQVRFFVQGTMPAIGLDGKLIIGAKDSLALSPNGHGGTLLALRASGCLDKMAADGVEYLSYFQVDNPLVPIADPLFIGLHILEGSQISSRMLPKTCPTEKLGNFCLSGGRLHVIEYSDMPLELAERLNPDGTLAFLSGSPAIHVISRSFVEALTQDGTLKLPWHRADKKVPYLAADGTTVKPDAVNAVKLESFIFDALPLAERAIVVEGSRKEMFGPTKNATGVDSAESCRAMLVARDARRLALAGIQVPRGEDGFPAALVEISPRSVVDDADAVDYFKENPVADEILPGQSRAFGI